MIKPEYATYRYTKKSCGAPFYTIRLMDRLPLFDAADSPNYAKRRFFIEKNK